MTDFEKYFKALQDHRVDEITEHSHRSNLQQLLESIASPKTKVLHEPKREGKFGSPDFKITQVESIIGYVENKKIEENLDKILKTDQIKKYQALSDNILITNYIEWIWIKEGKIQQRETLCFLTDIEDKRKKLNTDKVKAVEKLIKSFFSQAPKEIADSKKLAEALAIRAKLLKDFLLEELQRQEKGHNEGRLFQLYETFKSFVFHELTIEEFADAFAQNLAYGLFLAKLNADTNSVNLYNAKKYIPSSFELIRELVNFLDELDNEEYRETKWIVEEVLTIMNNLDLKAIHESLSFTKKKKDKDSDDITIKDPYVYFYEDFLASYDKQLRKSKGVYYTPPPVVNFIVRSIDEILKQSFKIKDGLADRNKVTVLDFAAGTGTFLVEVLQQIFENLPKDSGKKDLLIKEHILKNIFGFEYLIAPYTIAHLKLSQFLKDNDYDLKAKERLQIFLTNTLAPIDLQQKIPLLPALTEESKQAQEVKDKPILVITGNPPYSKKSKNNDPWIVNLVDAYKYVDGKRSKEKQSWFRDDYIKFIRFAQDKMDKVEEGIVGVITNHAFINNVTMPGMRQSLMNTFDQIYILNLNGSAKQEGKLPDGITKDENVFDIEQGVAISFFIKRKGLDKKVLYTDFWGTRRDKYLTCLKESIDSINWTELAPKTPDYYFVPKDEQHKDKYETFYSVADIFKIYSLPLMTGNDNITIHFTKQTLKKVLETFTEKSVEQIKTEFKIVKDTSNWTVSKAKTDVVNTKANKIYYRNILYRPFDERITFYNGNNNGFHSRPQFKVCKNMLFENIGLLLPRQISKTEFRHVFCTRLIPEMCAISTATKEQNQLFPLYLYPDATIAATQQKVSREENFTQDFRNYIDKLYGKGKTPEQILGYIYAVLHSETYRTKYIEFLTDKFARIPFSNDKKVFDKLSKLGTELIEAHLLEAEIDSDLGDFIGRGSNIVESISYSSEKKIGKIHINKTQYFNDVPLEVWEFQIGGYQVIDKFLKERKNRGLSIDEVEKVTSIINTIAFSIEQIKKIENLTKNWI
jgi:predicted helicase